MLGDHMMWSIGDPISGSTTICIVYLCPVLLIESESCRAQEQIVDAVVARDGGGYGHGRVGVAGEWGGQCGPTGGHAGF